MKYVFHSIMVPLMAPTMSSLERMTFQKCLQLTDGEERREYNYD